MLFIPLPKLSSAHKKKIEDIYLRSKNSELYEDKNIVRVTNVFIDFVEYQNWIYDALIAPLNIPKNHIKNQYQYKNHKCCGMNFSVFNPGDWCYPHQDLNPTKIHFFWQGNCKKHNLFFPDENRYWDYESPVMINVSKNHTVSQIDKLTSPRVMFQVFLTEKIEYYTETLKKTIKKNFSWGV